MGSEFTIKDFSDIITMHLVYPNDCESTEENIIQCYTFSLCGYISHTQGTEPLTQGP